MPYHGPREEYWRELADYVRDHRRFAKLGLAIRNDSAVSAENVSVLMATSWSGVEIREVGDMPDYPESHFSGPYSINMAPGRFLPDKRPGLPAVAHQADQWEVLVEVDRIRPKETLWIPEPVLVSASESRTVEFRCTAYAANLKEPTRSALRLRLEVELLDKLEIDQLKEIDFRLIEEKLRREGQIGADDEE